MLSSYIMLNIVRDQQDSLLELLADDPVRPHIPREFRVGANRFVAVLRDSVPQAVVCVSLQDQVPENEQQLGSACEQPTVAVFYTIWSYESGAGTQILFDTVQWILEHVPTVQRFVTLSPKTRMADRFHRRNGARVFRENSDTVNYEYQLKAA
jgi:hypothetical protein